jgi:PAS domain S-box-containing protein
MGANSGRGEQSKHAAQPAFLAGGGEMAELVRKYDWASTPLGSVDTWPASLRSLTAMLLAHPFPTILLWGPEIIQIYNDGYKPIAAEKHPHALGQATKDCWPEVWHINQPIYEKVMKHGESVVLENQLFPVRRRNKHTENAYITLSYSPARDDDGNVAGVMLTIFETTEQHEAEAKQQQSEAKLKEKARQQEFLLKLSDQLRPLNSEEEIGKACTRLLAKELKLDRSYFVRFDSKNEQAHVGPEYHSAGIPPVSGLYPYAAFPEAIRQVETKMLVFNDVAKDTILPEAEKQALLALNFGAWIGAPVRSGHKKAEWALYAATKKPHEWSEAEVALINEAAERVWSTIERVRREAELRDNQQRQTFLLQLNETLRPLSNPEEVLDTALRLVGEQLDADRMVYAEVVGDEMIVNNDYVRGSGMTSMAGRYPKDAFGQAITDAFFTSGVYWEEDIPADPKLAEDEKAMLGSMQCAAYLGSTLVKQGLTVAFTVHSATPRIWTKSEISLIEELATTIWTLVERVRAEARLRGSEERLRLALEAAKLGAWELNLQTGESPARSPHHDRIFGHDEPLADWSLEIFLSYVHADDRKRVKQSFDAALQTGNWAFECRVVRADGKTRWIIAEGVFRYDDHGNPLRAIGIIQDISERKQAEKDQLSQHELETKNATLAQQREELLELNQAKDEFISLASHQLRTPATSVKQYLGMVLDEYFGEVPPDQREMLRIANLSNERQIKLINDLLNVARADTGDLKLQKSPVNLSNLVKYILADQKSVFSERQQTVAVTGQTSGLEISADREKLRTVLENLLDNASKYSPEHTNITVNLRITKKYARITITDQGVGIDESDQSKLFQKFSRLDNPGMAATGGTGLGLYWSKQIITLHGGKIAVSSTPTKGSTFTITLPTSK